MNWIYGSPSGPILTNPNTVPTSATGMKPAISRLVTDSLRFVIFLRKRSGPGSFPLAPGGR
jgi:hypothetical protein